MKEVGACTRTHSFLSLLMRAVLQFRASSAVIFIPPPVILVEKPRDAAPPLKEIPTSDGDTGTEYFKGAAPASRPAASVHMQMIFAATGQPSLAGFFSNVRARGTRRVATMLQRAVLLGRKCLAIKCLSRAALHRPTCISCIV